MFQIEHSSIQQLSGSCVKFGVLSSFLSKSFEITIFLPLLIPYIYYIMYISFCSCPRQDLSVFWRCKSTSFSVSRQEINPIFRTFFVLFDLYQGGREIMSVIRFFIIEMRQNGAFLCCATCFLMLIRRKTSIISWEEQKKNNETSVVLTFFYYLCTRKTAMSVFKEVR